MLGVTLILMSLLNAGNYFVVYNSNKAFIVRSDSAVFWVRVGKAMKIVSEKPSNTPRSRLFDPGDRSWMSKNHDFWAALLSTEGIQVSQNQKITVSTFENLLKRKAKNKAKYARLNKTTKMILTLLATNYPNKKNEIPYSGGKIVIVNYDKLTQKDQYYIAAKSFMILSDSRVTPNAVKSALRKAFTDPDFAALMGVSGGGAPVTETGGAGETPAAGGAEVDTSLIKAVRMIASPDVCYIVFQTNQPVELDSVDIVGYEGGYQVITPLPKTIDGLDSIEVTFADINDVNDIIGAQLVGLNLVINKNKPVTFYVQVSAPGGVGAGAGGEGVPGGAEVSAGGEGAAAGGEEGAGGTVSEGGEETSPTEVINIDEGTGGAAGRGVSKSTFIVFLILLLAILIFLYLTYSRVNKVAKKVGSFDILIDDLRGTIQELSSKPAEASIPPDLSEKLSDITASVHQVLTFVQTLSVQLDGATSDLKESYETTVAQIRSSILKDLRELKNEIEQKLAALQAVTPPPTTQPQEPARREFEIPSPSEEELAGNPPEASEMFEELGPSEAETEIPSRPEEPTIMEISPSAPAPPEPETKPEPVGVEEQPPRKAENIRAMLASLAQKLKKLQDNPILRAAVLVRDMVNAVTEPSKKMALQHTYQKFFDVAEGWDRIKNQVRMLREVASGQLPETPELRMEFEALEASVEDLSEALNEIEKTQNLKDYLPLIDAMSSYPNMEPRLKEFMRLLGIEEIEVPTGRPLTDDEAENVEVWDVEGFGTRQVVVDIIARGFRSSKTGEIIRKPRVKIRLE